MYKSASFRFEKNWFIRERNFSTLSQIENALSKLEERDKGSHCELQVLNTLPKSLSLRSSWNYLGCSHVTAHALKNNFVI